MKASVAEREVTASSGSSARTLPSLTASRNDVIHVQWSAESPESAGTLQGITLHVFLDRAGSSKPTANALYESAVILDFDPRSKSSGEFKLPVSEAGSYVLRAETIGASKKLGRESAAVMTVVVR